MCWWWSGETREEEGGGMGMMGEEVEDNSSGTGKGRGSRGTWKTWKKNDAGWSKSVRRMTLMGQREKRRGEGKRGGEES